MRPAEPPCTPSGSERGTLTRILGRLVRAAEARTVDEAGRHDVDKKGRKSWLETNNWKVPRSLIHGHATGPNTRPSQDLTYLWVRGAARWSLVA